jgi:uncharacterized membrane protein
MKTLNKKMIFCVIIALAGIALFVVNILKNVYSGTTTGFASAITAVSIIKLFQFYRISKSPQLLKRYEIVQREERFLVISEKSGRSVFLLTIVAEFVAILVLILIGHDEISTIVSYIAGIQAIVYLIMYYYFSKKY